MIKATSFIKDFICKGSSKSTVSVITNVMCLVRLLVKSVVIKPKIK